MSPEFAYSLIKSPMFKTGRITPEFLLKKAKTGNEILTALDTIIDELEPLEELAQSL